MDTQGASGDELPPFLQRASQHNLLAPPPNLPAAPQKPEANFLAQHEVEAEEIEAAAQDI